MKSISGKKLCKIVEKKGWILKKITGSHHIYEKTMRIKLSLFLYIEINHEDSSIVRTRFVTRSPLVNQ
jgi:hypothetical protein